MENFIEKVKKNPCLWKTDDMGYRDTRKKDLTWKQVARQCGIADGE